MTFASASTKHECQIIHVPQANWSSANQASHTLRMFSIKFYYMALSHKDWELPDSRI